MIQIIFLLLLSLCAANGFGQTYFIGEVTANIIDTDRSNRSIETKIFYPATAQGAGKPIAGNPGEQFPLIVIGHGFAMTYDAYQNFWEKLVPRGYIVALPTTESAIIPFPSHTDFGMDLAKIVEYFQAENLNSASIFYEKVSDKTAIMGHSMGGGASFLAAANNLNVTTLVGFAPAETNPSAISAAPSIDIPALIFIGSKDNVATAADNATPLYNGLSSACKTYITITDGNHCQFANQNTTCELGETSVCLGCNFISRQDQHSITFSFLNPWLDFHLKGICSEWVVFQDRLTTSQQITFQQNCNITDPEAEFSVTGDTVSCQGGIATLTASGDYEFTWSTGDSARIITLDSTGNYFLVVEDEYGCKDTSGSISFVVGGGVIPEIKLSSDNVLCENDSMVLSVVGNFVDYQWSDGSTDDKLTINDPGLYFVKLTDAYGCEIYSDTIEIMYAASPDIPIIQLIGDSLMVVSDDAIYYQWFFDNDLLDGFNDDYLEPYFEGVYTVQIWDSNGCSSNSENFDYQFSSVQHFSLDNELTVYPNPTNGILNIKSDFQEIRLYNLMGKELNYKTNLSPLDLSGLSDGVYFLKVRRGGKFSFTKVIKN